MDENKKITFRDFYKISKWIFGFVISINPLYATVSLTSSIIINLQNLLNIYIFTRILDKLIKLAQSGTASIKDVYPYILLLIAVNGAITLIRFFRRYAQTGLRTFSRPRIRTALYTKVNSLGVQTLEQPEINNKIDRANNYLGDILSYYDELSALISNVVSMITSFVIVANFAPILIPVLIFISVPGLIYDRIYRKKIWKFDFDTTESRRIAGATADDLTNAIKLQEIFINEAFHFLDNKFTKFYEWYSNESMKIRKSWYTKTFTLDFLSDAGIYLGYLIILARFIANKVTVGNLWFQIQSIETFQNSLSGSVEWINDMFEYSIRIKDTYELFQAKPAFADGTIKMKPLTKGPEIEFKNVSFKYPNSEKFVIQDFNLIIKPGGRIAIVGHNGAGKTTLVRLLCRMYQVNKGEILINGTNINDLSGKSWFENMGVLFQDFNTHPYLNVKENIALGKPDKEINEEEVKKAAENADATGFIESFPNKFDQILTEKIKGGIRPSTGQWQKIAIARFFYRNAPLLIFDEPTASIDAVSEYNIFNKIYDFFQEKTVILISHRFSTVRNADRIIVLENGKIIEEGSHEKLMNQNGYYANAFTLQASGYVSQIV